MVFKEQFGNRQGLFTIQKNFFLIGYDDMVSLVNLEDGSFLDIPGGMYLLFLILLLLLTLNLGIGGDISAVAHDTNNHLLFSGTINGSINYWKYSHNRKKVGNEIEGEFREISRASLHGHNVMVKSLLVVEDCTDGHTRLVAGYNDGLVFIWKKDNVNDTFSACHQLMLHKSPVSKLFNYKNYLIAQYFDAFSVWDMLTGILHTWEISKEVPKDIQYVQAFYVSISNGYLSCIHRNSVQVWDIKSGTLVSAFTLNLRLTEYVFGILLENYYLFVFISPTQVRVYHIVQQTLVTTLHKDNGRDVIFPPLNSFSLIGKGNSMVLIVSSSSGYFLEFGIPPTINTTVSKKRKIKTS